MGQEETIAEEPLCADCNHCYPATNGQTSMSICLLDAAFDPYIEDLMENADYSNCRDLIEEKQFDMARPACDRFQPCERIEIDGSPQMLEDLVELFKQGNVTEEAVENLVLDEWVRQTDWTTLPMDDLATALREAESLEEQKETVNQLGGYIALGNEQAFHLLKDFFRELPPPERAEENSLRTQILKQLDYADRRREIAPLVLEDLLDIPSNNTTRRWYVEAFKFFARCPEEVREGIGERIVDSDHFSYRLKRKAREQLLWPWPG